MSFTEIQFSFLWLQELVGTGILFASFGVIAIASLLFIFYVVPETKGLSLEEIEEKILWKVQTILYM